MASPNTQALRKHLLELRSKNAPKIIPSDYVFPQNRQLRRQERAKYIREQGFTKEQRQEFKETEKRFRKSYVEEHYAKQKKVYALLEQAIEGAKLRGYTPLEEGSREEKHAHFKAWIEAKQKDQEDKQKELAAAEHQRAIREAQEQAGLIQDTGTA